MSWCASAPGTEAQPQWTVLTCLDARGGLGAAADGYQRRLAAVCRPRQWPLAVLRVGEDARQPRRVSTRLSLLDNKGWREQPASGPTTTVEAAIGRAADSVFRTRPARHTLLLIVGHGTGLLETEEARGLDTVALGHALDDASTALGQPVDVLGLDTCFGGSIEKLWQFRRSARVMTAAPGLVYSPGLRWAEALRRCPSGGARELAAAVTQMGMADEATGAMLVSLDSAALPAVTEQVKALAGALGGQMAASGRAGTAIRSQTHSWGRREELCDLGEWAAGWAASGPEETSRGIAEQLGRRLAEATISAWRSRDMPAKGPSGVGIYFPRTVEMTPPTYQQQLRFAADSGWYGFLTAYGEWLTSLVSGGPQP